MEKNSKIYVAGHRGMVGSAIVRELQKQGYNNIITRTHKELDLCRQDQVEAFFAQEKPEYVFLAAAKVGGIIANQSALADFMYENMILEMNVIHSAWKNGCKKLVAKVVGYKGEIHWDTTRPNGTPRKLLDVSKAEKMGWRYKTELEEGIRLSYEDFLHNPMRAER